VTFNLTLLFNGDIASDSKYRFSYQFLGSEKQTETNSPNEIITIDLDGLNYGLYEVNFVARTLFIFDFVDRVDVKVSFNVTNRFNGLIELKQNSTVRENGYVSSQAKTVHNLLIADKDRKLIEKAAYYRVFWFVDCLFVGEWKKQISFIICYSFLFIFQNRCN
jgi:hypothetical protein